MHEVGDIMGSRSTPEQKLRRAVLLSISGGYASNITAALYSSAKPALTALRQDRLRRLRKAAANAGLTVPIGDDEAIESAIVRFARHVEAIDRIYPESLRLNSRIVQLKAA